MYYNSPYICSVKIKQIINRVPRGTHKNLRVMKSKFYFVANCTTLEVSKKKFMDALIELSAHYEPTAEISELDVEVSVENCVMVTTYTLKIS